MIQIRKDISDEEFKTLADIQIFLLLSNSAETSSYCCLDSSQNEIIIII